MLKASYHENSQVLIDLSSQRIIHTRPQEWLPRTLAKRDLKKKKCVLFSSLTPDLPKVKLKKKKVYVTYLQVPRELLSAETEKGVVIFQLSEIFFHGVNVSVLWRI